MNLWYVFVFWVFLQEEKQHLEQKLRKTEEDLTRQLNYAQQVSHIQDSSPSELIIIYFIYFILFILQTLSEKSRELDKLRSEWTSQTTSLSSRHMQDLTAEREKALEVTRHP